MDGSAGTASKLDSLQAKLELLMLKHSVPSLSLSINTSADAESSSRTIVLERGEDSFKKVDFTPSGSSEADAPTLPAVQVASLSKTLGSAFALDFLSGHCLPPGTGGSAITADTPVNDVLRAYGGRFLLRDAADVEPGTCERVLVRHLMNHSGLGMHYVHGFARAGEEEGMPPSMEELLLGPGGFRCANGQFYERVEVAKEPGKLFAYSGGGFLVLQYLVELIDRYDRGATFFRRIEEITRPFLDRLGMHDFTFQPEGLPPSPRTYYPQHFNDEAQPVPRWLFPSFAAGSTGTTKDFVLVLKHLTDAFQGTVADGPLSQTLAQQMLRPVPVSGGFEFMRSQPGLGTFILPAGENKVMIHQGANEGVRCFYCQCFSGPDLGKGFIISTIGDESAMRFNCEAVILVLAALDFRGIDFPEGLDDVASLDLAAGLDLSHIPQEQRVNTGLKETVLARFRPEPRPAA